MMKTPEEYFQEQDFGTGPVDKQSDFTPAERAFMQKYLGMNEGAVLDKLGIDSPAAQQASSGQEPVAAPAAQAVQQQAPQIEREPDLDEQLRSEPELQLVSFYLADQEFTVPIMAVQEVIKYIQPTRLPAAPHFVAGVVNLRGRVTPLVRTKDLLGTSGGDQEGGGFIVVCRRHGLQLGLMIDAVHTMYRTAQESIDWSIEARLGSNVEYISGLMKSGEHLIGIISVDRIVDSVLQL